MTVKSSFKFFLCFFFLQIKKLYIRKWRIVRTCPGNDHLWVSLIQKVYWGLPTVCHLDDLLWSITWNRIVATIVSKFTLNMRFQEPCWGRDLYLSGESKTGHGILIMRKVFNSE